MALNDDDVREILRIIDESDLDELRIETDGLSLHVLRGGATSAFEPDPVAERRAPAPRGAASEDESDGLTIASPEIGIFHRAPAPGATPFVEIGTVVEAGTIVGIVEVMKMMNSVAAGISGTIVEVLVENAQLVEYGQPLFRVEAG
jgi:acetyl-CoA carboxylase biotin carboxyl carrier protein